MASANLIGLAFASLILAGCQNMVGSSGVYYNVGLEQASNNLLLTNVIRSAKGYPNYYSVLGDYSAGTSVGLSPSGSANIPLDASSWSPLNASLSANVGRDRSANASSLETRDFTRAMHTQVTPQLFAFLIESRDGAHIHLLMSLLVKAIVVTLDDYNDVVFSAHDICKKRYQTLSSAHRGICQNFENSFGEITCKIDRHSAKVDQQSRYSGTDILVKLSNDATSRCTYTQFRAFSEALSITNAKVEGNEDGKVDISFTRTGLVGRSLFNAQGTGLTLRSPNGIIHFLGEIVRDQFAREDPWTPTLTTRNGRSVPIFKVEAGSRMGRGSISAKIDNRVYWIRQQELGAPENDFSYRALTIVKDLQTLNTAQEQLPDNPTIILGPR